MKHWILEELARVGRSWDAKNPFVDATLTSGHRVHVTFPPLSSRGILISLRRLSGRFSAENGPSRWAHAPLFPVLRDLVARGDSLLVAGATGSGKTTLANDLLSHVPGQERILGLEDTPELSPDHPHFLSLLSRPPNADGFGEVTLRTLLRQALRMRPDRIVLGECRGNEVLDLLQTLNTGHRGALATVHANSARDALRRIELLCLLAAPGALSVSTIRELVCLGVQWITFVRRTGEVRQITELWRIEGREGDTILLRPFMEECHQVSTLAGKNPWPAAQRG